MQPTCNTLDTVPLNFWPSGHCTSVLFFKGCKWTLLKARLIKVPLDSREHKKTNIKTKHIFIYVGKQCLAWFCEISGFPQLDSNAFSEVKHKLEILVIHATAYCSMRKKQVCNFYLIFFFPPLRVLFFHDNIVFSCSVHFESFSGNENTSVKTD